MSNKNKYYNFTQSDITASASKNAVNDETVLDEATSYIPENDNCTEADESNNTATAEREHVSLSVGTDDTEEDNKTRNNKQHVTLSSEAEEEKPELIVELSKVYEYDGIEVDSVDISGIEHIPLHQQEKVDKIYRKISKTATSTPEFTPEYAVAMTHVLTGIPLEVIKQFSLKDKIRIKNKIMVFLYGEE